MRCPLCGEEYPLGEALAKAPPGLILLDASAPVAASGTAPEAGAERAEFRFVDGYDDGQIDGQIDGQFNGQFQDGERRPDSIDGAVGPYLGSSRMSSSGSASSSALRQCVGIVVGAVLGLALGYLALLWIGGPTKDFLHIREHLPPVMLPPGFAEEPADDPVGD